MDRPIGKRALILGTAGMAAAAIARPGEGHAQTGGLLDRLRQAGSVRIAVPQTPPWSEIKPDGTIAGIAPEIITPALRAVGIPKLEAVPTTYAELIPGLMAGRWDMIGACLTVSKARCNAVRFSSPICFGYLSVVYRPGEMKDPPTSLAEAARRGLTIATNVGGYQLPMLRRLTTSDKLVLFNDSGATVEAVAAKRADIGIDSYYGMRIVKAAEGLAFTPGLTDTGLDKSAPAFRLTDGDLFAAVDAEIRKLRTSGLVAEVNQRYGYTYDDTYNAMDSAAACSSANT